MVTSSLPQQIVGWFQEQRIGKKMFSEVVTREEVGG